MKNIVITGVSTGIGYGSAKEFINNGYVVFGSVRKQEDADRLKIEFGKNFIPLIFDVRDNLSITKAVKVVEEQIGDNGLTGLINNAGAAEGAPLMHMPLDIFRNHLEVLVIGQLAVTQAFLPLLGAKIDFPFNPGRIINITSVSGKMAAPFLGAYVAAKHALEGLSNALRIELQIYGIDVIIVGPGMIKTAIWDKASDDIIEKYINTDYYTPYKKLSDYFSKILLKEAFELEDFCSRLRKIFESKKPRTRYTIVKSKFRSWILPRLFSDRMTDKYFARMIGLNRINKAGNAAFNKR